MYEHCLGHEIGQGRLCLYNIRRKGQKGSQPGACYLPPGLVQLPHSWSPCVFHQTSTVSSECCCLPALKLSRFSCITPLHSLHWLPVAGIHLKATVKSYTLALPLCSATLDKWLPHHFKDLVAALLGQGSFLLWPHSGGTSH